MAGHFLYIAPNGRAEVMEDGPPRSPRRARLKRRGADPAFLDKAGPGDVMVAAEGGGALIRLGRSWGFLDDAG